LGYASPNHTVYSMLRDTIDITPHRKIISRTHAHHTWYGSWYCTCTVAERNVTSESPCAVFSTHMEVMHEHKREQGSPVGSRRSLRGAPPTVRTSRKPAQDPGTKCRGLRLGLVIAQLQAGEVGECPSERRIGCWGVWGAGLHKTPEGLVHISVR